jgi:hypothetical protein
MIADGSGKDHNRATRRLQRPVVRPTNIERVAGDGDPVVAVIGGRNFKSGHG